MLPAIVLQPLSGFPLATRSALQPLSEFWILVAPALFAVIVVCWIFAMRTEINIRGLAREAALELSRCQDLSAAIFAAGLCLPARSSSAWPAFSR